MVEDTNFEDDQLASMTTDDIVRATRLLDNEIRILKVSVLSQYDSSLNSKHPLSLKMLIRSDLSVR